MSIPRTLDVPDCASAATIETTRGVRAALITEPAGPPRGTAVLVPGFTGSKEDFVAVLGPLTERGYRVVTYDQRGQYQTPDQAGAIDPDDPGATLSEDLLALLDAVHPDEPVHLLGHSMGGLVARRAAIAAPQRLASLTLLCSGPAAIPEEQRPLLQVLNASLGQATLEQLWVAKEQMDAAAGVEPLPPAIASFLHQRFVSNDHRALAAKARLLMSEPDRCVELTAAAAGYGMPLLVACGDSDDVWLPATQTEMAARLGAEMTVIPDAGHSPAVDQPMATAAVLAAHWDRSGRQV